MVPPHLHTQVLFDQLQREAEQRRLPAGASERLERGHLRERLGALFAALGPGTPAAAQPDLPPACSGACEAAAA